MSRRIRIALLITELNVGGAERALTNLAIGLPRPEFEVVVYSLAARPTGTQAELAEQLERAGVVLHFLAAHGVWQAPATLLRLRRLIHQQQADVLLSFLYHANVLGGLAVAFMRKPPAHVAAVRVAEPSSWRLRLERPFLRRAAAVTCVSTMLAEYVMDHQQVPRTLIHEIPNGVDVERFAMAEPADLTSHGIAPQRRLLTAIARMENQKGLDWLLSEIDQLLDRLPEFDLLLVGDGPLRANLQQQVRGSNSSDRIHFLGQRSDVPAILKRSSLLLLPSRYEGMPNVVLEAMAAGLPVVARNVEGVTELLGTPPSPQIAPFGDINGFYDTVCQLALSPALMATLGRENQQRARVHFSLQATLDAYVQVLRTASRESSKKSS